MCWPKFSVLDHGPSDVITPSVIAQCITITCPTAVGLRVRKHILFPAWCNIVITTQKDELNDKWLADRAHDTTRVSIKSIKSHSCWISELWILHTLSTTFHSHSLHLGGCINPTGRNLETLRNPGKTSCTAQYHKEKEGKHVCFWLVMKWDEPQCSSHTCIPMNQSFGALGCVRRGAANVWRKQDIPLESRQHSTDDPCCHTWVM